MTRRRSWVLVVALCLCVPLAGACKKKGPGPEDGVGGPDSGLGMGEEGLAGGSSLGRAQKGLSPEEDGVLKDVNFGYDSDEVEPGETAVLEQNLDWLQQNSRAKVELEGHCDSRGTIEYNLALGEKRAKAARDYLVTLGVPAGNLRVTSYGESRPFATGTGEAAWAQNRRAHFERP